MQNNKVLLGVVGEWERSKYYFDKENNVFLEEKYHDEYLDTGTFFDGSEVVSPQHIYNSFIEHMNVPGIENLLKYCDEKKLNKTSEKGIAEEIFYNKLCEISKELKENLVQREDEISIYDSEGVKIGTISKEAYFYTYMGLSAKSKGFKTQNEVFDYAIDCLRLYYELKARDETREKIKAVNKRDAGSLIPPEKVASINKTMKWKKIKKHHLK